MRILWLGWEDAYTPARMTNAAAKHGITLAIIQITDIEWCVERGRIGAFRAGKNLVDSFDVLVARTFHPYISEALTLARMFADAGKTVIDESLTDEGYVISKMHDYVLLAQHALPVPQTWQAYTNSAVLARCAELGYPCVLKGMHGSHGAHVFLANGDDEIVQRLSAYSPGALLVQQYLPAHEDYRLLVIGYQTLPVMVSREPDPGDFRTNVGHGASAASRKVEDYVGLAELAAKSAKVLRREFAGVDIRFHDGKPYVLEVNRRPIFENFELVTGYDVADVFLRYIANKAAANSKSV